MKKKREFTHALKNSLDKLTQARKHWEDIEEEVANQPIKEESSGDPKERIQDDAQNLLKTLKNKLDDFS